MWDVYIRRACFGWKVALRPVTIRDFDSKFRETIWNGTNSDLFKIISEQRWSVHDRDTSGQTMLDVRPPRAMFASITSLHLILTYLVGYNES